MRPQRRFVYHPPGGGAMESAGQTRVERRLAAILAADVAGYSRLMADEEGTFERLRALRRELVDPKIAEHRGRIPGSRPGTKTTGDSVVDAVHGAVAVQQAMPERNTDRAAD